jgi:hypothetical protein
MSSTSPPITLNHYQLKSLLEDSDMYGVGPADVQSVVVAYRCAEDPEAYAGPGLYSVIAGVDLEAGSYLALDQQDHDRAQAIRQAEHDRSMLEYEAVEAQVQAEDALRCKGRATCMLPHGAAWLFKVPAEAKGCKSVGRCLCDEYRQATIEVELEIPLEG